MDTTDSGIAAPTRLLNEQTPQQRERVSKAEKVHQIWMGQDDEKEIGPFSQQTMVEYIRKNYGYTDSIAEEKLSYLCENKRNPSRILPLCRTGKFCPGTIGL